MAVWTAEQTAVFLRHAGSHPLHAVFHVAALTGLRRGEILGLRWCDLDLAGASLTVTHQIQERDGRAVICLPKSTASGRAVSLDRGTVALLVGLRPAQRREGRGAADGWVFARENGSHWSPSYVSHTFRRLIEKAGLPPVRFHDLRHGAATLSLAAGNDLKTVQALLGHASIVLTADTYTSVLPSLAQACAEATASLVRRAGYDRGGRSAGQVLGLAGKGDVERSDTVRASSVPAGLRVGPTAAPARTHRSTKPTDSDPEFAGKPLVGFAFRLCAIRDSNPEPAG